MNDRCRHAGAVRDAYKAQIRRCEGCKDCGVRTRQPRRAGVAGARPSQAQPGAATRLSGATPQGLMSSASPANCYFCPASTYPAGPRTALRCSRQVTAVSWPPDTKKMSVKYFGLAVVATVATTKEGTTFNFLFRHSRPVQASRVFWCRDEDSQSPAVARETKGTRRAALHLT